MASPHPKKSGLAAWLDKIQQDSWQLELVISGVAIFLLLGAYAPLEEISLEIRKDQLVDSLLLRFRGAVFVIFRFAYYALLTTFLLHILLRGLWIGAVGLRSVSGDFDYSVLGFQPRYTIWLRKQLGSFDDYIERLETQCSVAFSFAFLIFFCLLSVGSYGLFIGAVSILFLTSFGYFREIPPPWIVQILGAINLILVLFGLLYLIDFSSLGFFKKRRWLQRIYYPFYRFMGWITLARVYRPFYYNLIDHPFGRRLVRYMWLVILAAMFVVSFSVVRFQYFPIDTADATIITPGHYLDEVTRKDIDLTRPSLASRYAERDYMEIFLPYQPLRTDKKIQTLYPDLAAAHSSPVAVDGPLHLWHSENYAANNDSLLSAHRSLYRLYLNDSLLTGVPWRFYEHPMRQQPGLRYDLPVYDLPRGEHTLRIDHLLVVSLGDTSWSDGEDITFLR